ncbi:MAG: AzlD domain-containing protein [Tissierellales bacterium]|jgi:branched-subunit amino acid transport protein|nr:AzlD domain-containing protein [Tissierellales bacterium]
MNRIFILIMGMMVVTYLPRVLPFYVMGKLKLNSRIEQSLKYIPYAALGALVIPGGFSGVKERPLVSIGALGAAVLLSYIKENLFLSVVGSVGFAYICLMMFP